MPRLAGSKNKNKKIDIPPVEKEKEKIITPINPPPNFENELKEKQKEEFKNLNDIAEEKTRKPRITKEEKEKLKAEETEQKKREFISEMQGVGSMILEAVVKRLPNPIPLDEQESKNFDALFTKVAFKYSSYLGSYQEEISLLAVGALIIIPRLKKSEENKNEFEKEKVN